ncbi:hypothetical protein SB2_13555 [Methylobacterium radiotolerans]|nr:hypothetical protein SB3_24330 [Methylobacterium radiotolerans]KTS47315.1 hypothetical protein SB2_13555 [Methylobacterium radiotolerans]
MLQSTVQNFAAESFAIIFIAHPACFVVLSEIQQQDRFGVSFFIVFSGIPTEIDVRMRGSSFVDSVRKIMEQWVCSILHYIRI